MYSKLTEIKIYWCDENVPSIDIIMEAFEIVKEEKCIVELRWSFPYSGKYSRYIKPDVVESLTPEEFLEHYIPHIYGV